MKKSKIPSGITPQILKKMAGKNGRLSVLECGGITDGHWGIPAALNPFAGMTPENLQTVTGVESRAIASRLSAVIYPGQYVRMTLTPVIYQAGGHEFFIYTAADCWQLDPEKTPSLTPDIARPGKFQHGDFIAGFRADFMRGFSAAFGDEVVSEIYHRPNGCAVLKNGCPVMPAKIGDIFGATDANDSDMKFSRAANNLIEKIA